MRILVVAAEPAWTPGTRLMATLAAGLAARGDVVAIATSIRSATEAAVERTWPRLSVRSIAGAGWFRQALSLRAIVTALRPDALLVGSQADAVLAAYAAGKRGAIVRRLATDERAAYNGSPTSTVTPPAEEDDALPWRARYALTRARVALWGAERHALSWPVAEDTARGLAERDAAAGVHRLPVQPPEVVLVPRVPHDDRTAMALRVLARLHARLPELRVRLVGDAALLQATRLHAAAVGLTAAIELTASEDLLQHRLADVGAAWVTAPGDEGAVCALAAMQQRLPVVLPTDLSFADLVVPAVTGLLTASDAAVTTASELARVLSSADVRRTMGAAAAARADRHFEWAAFVDEAAARLAAAAGVAATRVTRRPALTPA